MESMHFPLMEFYPLAWQRLRNMPGGIASEKYQVRIPFFSSADVISLNVRSTDFGNEVRELVSIAVLAGKM